MAARNSTAYLPSVAGPAGDLLVTLVADGGPRLGFGHVGRCLALWEELEGRAAFSVNDETVAGFLEARGVHASPDPEAPIVLLDRARPTDAQEVRSLQAVGRRVVLLDDLGSGRIAADVVVDPPTAASWPPATGLRLGGFEHVLLRREVRLAASRAAPGGGVLLAIGGSDPAGLTPPLAEVLAGVGIDLTVALGPGYRAAAPITATIGADEFVPALARASLLVSGYGHSLLEAAHLGVPAITVVFRKEHLPHARAFCDAGTARMVDMTDGPRADELAALVGGLLGSDSAAALGRRGRELVDGAGAARVAAVLRALE